MLERERVGMFCMFVCYFPTRHACQCSEKSWEIVEIWTKFTSCKDRRFEYVQVGQKWKSSLNGYLNENLRVETFHKMDMLERYSIIVITGDVDETNFPP